MRLTRLHIFSF